MGRLSKGIKGRLRPPPEVAVTRIPRNPMTRRFLSRCGKSSKQVGKYRNTQSTLSFTKWKLIVDSIIYRIIFWMCEY